MARGRVAERAPRPPTERPRGWRPAAQEAAIGFCLLMLLTGCERERRAHRDIPPGAPAAGGRTTELVAGLPTVEVSRATYQESGWAVSQGRLLYVQFNCAGCHAPGGGGGMGPPLIDDHWIYGSEPEQVFSSIVEGRPNGMPSYRGRIASAQLWQIVAYVRSLSGLTPPDTWPGRPDHLGATDPARGIEPRPAPAPQ